MFCPQCGNELVEGKPFCTKCGAQVSAAPVAAAPVNRKSFIENIKEFLESLGCAKFFYLGTVVLSTLSFLFMFFPMYGISNNGCMIATDMFFSFSTFSPMVVLVIFAILFVLSAIAAVVLPAFMPKLRSIPFLYAAPAAIFTIIFFYVIIRWFVLMGSMDSLRYMMGLGGTLGITYPGVVYILVSLGAVACSIFLFLKSFKKCK